MENFKFAGGRRRTRRRCSPRACSMYFAVAAATSSTPTPRRLSTGSPRRWREFGNAYVRVEGNTDDVGGAAPTVTCRRRAQAVVDYLLGSTGFDRARFLSVGNGPDKPVGRQRHRRGARAEPPHRLSRRSQLLRSQSDQTKAWVHSRYSGSGSDWSWSSGGRCAGNRRTIRYRCPVVPRGVRRPPSRPAGTGGRRPPPGGADRRRSVSRRLPAPLRG